MSVTAQRMRGQRGQLTRMEFAIANSFHCELSHSRRSTFLVAPSSVSAWHQSLCRACPRGETRRVAKGAGHVAKNFAKDGTYSPSSVSFSTLAPASVRTGCGSGYVSARHRTTNASEGTGGSHVKPHLCGDVSLPTPGSGTFNVSAKEWGYRPRQWRSHSMINGFLPAGSCCARPQRQGELETQPAFAPL
eukprot:3888766-Rhodomonas_salina.5